MDEISTSHLYLLSALVADRIATLQRPERSGQAMTENERQELLETISHAEELRAQLGEEIIKRNEFEIPE